MGLTKQQVMQVVSRYIGVDSGYLGDFSYRTHTEFYPKFCDIEDIFPDELSGTTRERFIEILSSQTADRQARILRECSNASRSMVAQKPARSISLR